nr:hypothetical protein [uncultured Brevundimonas sp.]
MTAQPIQSSSIALPSWAALGFCLALAAQLAGLVVWGAKVEARTTELHATTEALRRGDLRAIQTDVSWIRAQLEREERR